MTWLISVHEAVLVQTENMGRIALPYYYKQIPLEEERNWRHFGNSLKLGVMIRKSQCREVLSCYHLPYYMKGMKEMNIVTGS